MSKASRLIRALLTQRAVSLGLYNPTCSRPPAVLRALLDASAVGEDPGGHHRRGLRLRQAVRSPAADLLLLPSAR